MGIKDFTKSAQKKIADTERYKAKTGIAKDTYVVPMSDKQRKEYDAAYKASKGTASVKPNSSKANRVLGKKS